MKMAASPEERIRREKLGTPTIQFCPVSVTHSSFQLFTAFALSYKIILFESTQKQPFPKQLISSYRLVNCQLQSSQGRILRAGFCSPWINRMGWMLPAARSAVTHCAQQVCIDKINLNTVRPYHWKETA